MARLLAGREATGRLWPFFDAAMDPERRAFLIKQNSPEPQLPLVPPTEEILDPFNRPRRLLMLQTSVLDIVGTLIGVGDVLICPLQSMGNRELWADCLSIPGHCRS